MTWDCRYARVIFGSSLYPLSLLLWSGCVVSRRLSRPANAARRGGPSAAIRVSTASGSGSQVGGLYRGWCRCPVWAGMGAGGSVFEVFVEAATPVQVQAGLSARTPMPAGTQLGTGETASEIGS